MLPKTTALPRLFRRPTLLIIGCGDVGMRVAKLLRHRWRLRALTSSPDRRAELRAAGIVPLQGNLDEPATLNRLPGLASRVLHLAPPPMRGRTDPRTKHLLQALRRSSATQHIVYGSTTGVYGDCQGALFDETRPVAPQTERAHRRVDAEKQLRQAGKGSQLRTNTLRIPGIYATDREGGPRERLMRGSPVLRPEEDVYTNHIHADDLARACVATMFRGKPQRVVQVCDDTDMKMGDYFELAASLYGLTPPPRISREQAQTQMSAMTLSFLGESRRLLNHRLKRELRLQLRYPTLETAVGADPSPQPPKES